VLGAIERVRKEDPAADFLVFGETVLSGYAPQDLVRIPGFVDKQLRCLDRVKEATAGWKGRVVLWCILPNRGPGKPLFNSLAVLRDGKEEILYHKALLPTYNIFDERRHFEPGNAKNTLDCEGRKVAFLICEDAWYGRSGSLYNRNPFGETLEREGGVDLLITVNASPSNLRKRGQRLDVYRDLCVRHRVPAVYVNQVGANDGIVFDGGSFAMDARGDIIDAAADFEEDLKVVDLAAPAKKPAYLLPEGEFLYAQLKLGLRDYVRKTGFQGVVIGESGGIDSAVVTAIAADALGPDKVIAITMPSKVSSAGSVDDSAALCENLGVRLFHCPIVEQNQAFMEAFNRTFEGQGIPSRDGNRLTEQNAQSRIRGQVLMSFSNRYGHLVLNTGNKSELSVGYFTLGGDSVGGIAILGDLYKMQVYRLARHYNERHGRELIPKAILDKEPSAELEPGQVDSRDLPPYPVLDALLKLYVEHADLPAPEYAECRAALDGKCPPETVDRILRMVTRNEFKRAVIPKCIHVNSTAFGFGWAMPIAQGYVPGREALDRAAAAEEQGRKA
jgi:NAD+ synthetase